MIVGDEKPDSGEIKIAASVKLAYIEQKPRILGTEQSVWQAISDGKRNRESGSGEMNSRAYVSRFGFTGTDQQKTGRAHYPAASAIACISPVCSRARTSFCLTNRPTIWM